MPQDLDFDVQRDCNGLHGDPVKKTDLEANPLLLREPRGVRKNTGGKEQQPDAQKPSCLTAQLCGQPSTFLPPTTTATMK